MAKVLW